MGQKVHPIGFRIPYTKTWSYRWYADKKNYAQWLHMDLQIEKFVRERLRAAGVSKVIIERTADKIRVNIYVARAGLAIGKKGAGVDALNKDLAKMVGPKTQIMAVIEEVRPPETDAKLVSEMVAQQLVRRVSFRRAMKKAVRQAMKLGVKGIKIKCSGRLGGAEMARKEWYMEGRVPLHTLRADIDYGFTVARTTYGTIGVKVWVYKGDVMPEKKKESK